MIVALLENEKPINMYQDWNCDMYSRRFYCPACKSEVIPCRGNERRYFRHRSLNDCPYNAYESESENRSVEHEAMKRWVHDVIVRDMKSNWDCNDLNSLERACGFVCEYEKYLSSGSTKIIPDIYLEYSMDGVKHKWGIEIQKSKKSEEHILDKNKKYKTLGVNPIWICNTNANLSKYATVIDEQVLFCNDDIQERYGGDWGFVKTRGFFYYNGDRSEGHWKAVMDKLDDNMDAKEVFEYFDEKDPVFFMVTNKECRRLGIKCGYHTTPAFYSCTNYPFVL